MNKMGKTEKFLFMNFGCILLATGVYFFKIPNGFATGGVSGISTIFARITLFSAGVWIWILNFTLMVLGFLFWENKMLVRLSKFVEWRKLICLMEK